MSEFDIFMSKYELLNNNNGRVFILESLNGDINKDPMGTFVEVREFNTGEKISLASPLKIVCNLSQMKMLED